MEAVEDWDAATEAAPRERADERRVDREERPPHAAGAYARPSQHRAPSATLQRAVEYALTRNVVVIAATGNCGTRSGTAQCPSLKLDETVLAAVLATLVWGERDRF